MVFVYEPLDGLTTTFRLSALTSALVNSLLDTNAPPFYQDEPDLHHALHDAQIALQHVDDAVGHFGGSLQGIQSQRDQLATLITHLKRVVSPLRRTPPEVICEILSLACSTESHSLDVSQGLWPFTRVCSRWRQIVLAHPSRWATIDVDPPSLPRLSHHQMESILTVLLTRSGSCPLDIRFVCPDDGAGKVLPMFRLIVEQSYRWRSISGQFPYNYLTHIAKARGNVPLLESVALSVVGTPRYGGKLNAFEFAPNLKRVSLIRSDTRFTVIPWLQITSCRLGCSPKMGCSVLQKMAPCLEDLTVDVDHDYSGAVVTPHLILPSLKQLAFSGTDPGRVIDRLVCPQLESVHVSFTVLQHLPRLLSALTARSGCVLKEFSFDLWGGSLHDDEFLAIVQVVPSITSLKITLPGSCDPPSVESICSFLTRLTLPDDRGIYVLPNVSRIRVCMTKAQLDDINMDELTKKLDVVSMSDGRRLRRLLASDDLLVSNGAGNVDVHLTGDA